MSPSPPPFNILAVVQEGRLAYEALLLAASLRRSDPAFQGTLYLAEPQPGPLWPEQDPRLRNPALRARLVDLGAVFLPFESRVFGASYPNGNKIEALAALPDAPFLFLDSDSLITGPLSELPLADARPAASMRREDTWPQEELYGPDRHQTWQSLYQHFGLDFDKSLDPAYPQGAWRHYLYFNAGWFCAPSPRAFGQNYLAFATEIRDRPPESLICQPLYPWLDQIALPLAISAAGGGRPGPALAPLDHSHSCHYRTLPLLYARESDHCVSLLEEICRAPENRRFLRDWPQAKEMVYRRQGQKARALFADAPLPAREAAIRNRLRREGLWLR